MMTYWAQSNVELLIFWHPFVCRSYSRRCMSVAFVINVYLRSKFEEVWERVPDGWPSDPEPREASAVRSQGSREGGRSRIDECNIECKAVTSARLSRTYCQILSKHLTPRVFRSRTLQVFTLQHEPQGNSYSFHITVV